MSFRFLYKAFAVCLMLVAGGMLSCPAHAESKQDLPWINQFLAAQEKQNCQAMWDTLWPKAKKGDIEARFALFMATWSPPKMTVIRRPGFSHDRLAYMRDLGVFTVFSTGIKNEDKSSITDSYYEMFDRVYDQLNFKKIGGEDFLKCVKKKRSAECTKIAVDNKLVPSFEDYAKEVDLAVKNGRKPECVFPSENNKKK